tara:strand:+ start:277 stop:522 length:246 start_codon:yes stop_codon:yes gene_type:complete
MLLTMCGYNLSDERIEQLNEFLKSKNAEKVDINILIATLTHLKQLELDSEEENQADEYLDAFVALGGSPDKEGHVSKEVII